jgi:hypothetical protein
MTEMSEAVDEWLRLERIEQGIHEQLRLQIEFMRARVHEIDDPAVRAKVIAAIADFDREDE